MAKQKRKAPGVPEKKRKTLKKAAAESPGACEGTQGSEEAPEGGVSCLDPEPTPELTPEEKRVLERKLKKERRKEERKQLREAGTALAQPPRAQHSSAQLALDYLCSWARKQEDWRFQKTRQTWLLMHMYDSDQVPEEHFPALLAYLEGLKGQARELTVQKAEALMRELDQAGTADLGPLLWAKTRRVRQVLQLLS
ncbi:protein cholesin isoform X2 [Desmodus rotundus]